MTKAKMKMSGPRPSWYFEQLSAMGGASSGAYQNSLAGVGVPHAELFAREAIQNSVDAAEPGAPSVAVRFRAEEAGGERLKRLRHTLGMAEGSQPLQRAGLLRPGEEGDLVTRLRPPLRVLYVEDFNTVGLGGTTRAVAPTEEDNYFRLALTLGDTRAREGGGGTFGYGKSVYWAMSSLWTIVFYSRFASTDRTNNASARLIAVSWFNAHTHPDQSGQKIRYTGRAWFGVVDEQGCSPAVDDEAHDLAEQLGFERRGPSDRGLSIMILGSQVDMEGLREGVEQHWWPRLLDGRLEVSFLLDGQELPAPRPRSHPTLSRFVRAWDLAKGKVEPGTRDVVKELTYKRSLLGRFAITTGSEDHEEEFGDPQGTPRPVQIALVRDPGMVVEYLVGPSLSATQPACSAVFATDSAMNRVFAASEPPAHNKWDSRTIKRGALTNEERAQIEHTLEKIRSAARAFVQSKQVPPPTPPPRCRELERMLGKWIGIAPDVPPPPPPGSSPFHLRFVEEVHRVETGDGVTLDAKIEVSLREDPTLEPENLVRVRAWVDTLVDDGAAAPKEDRLQMSYIFAMEPAGAQTAGEADTLGSFVTLVLSPGGLPWLVDLRSNVLPHSEYRAALTVSAELE